MPAGKDKPIVIAGMGPGGLAAAITAAKQGHHVLIIEPRDHFSRVQRVQADKGTMDFLASLREKDLSKETTEDKRFFEDQINSVEGTVQVKDVQAFLTRKLRSFPNVDIRLGKGNNIIEINPSNQIITLESPDKTVQTIPFSHLIAADGAKHGVTELLNKAKIPAFSIAHQPLAIQPRQEEVGTISLQLIEGSAPPVPPQQTNPFKIEHLKKLEEMGWDKPYYPKVYVFKNKKSTKFFVSGEIPSNIKHMQDKKAQKEILERWGKFMVHVHLGYQENAVKLAQQNNPTQDARKEEKNNLRTTVFPLQLQAANNPSVKLGKNGAFALVGDAFKSANFFFAHGLNDAINDGLTASNSISADGDTFDFGQYNTYQTKQKERLNSRMKWDTDPDTLMLKAFIDNHKLFVKAASQFNQPEVKTYLKSLVAIAQPGEADFDARKYQLHIDELIGALKNAMYNKENQPTKHRGILFNNDTSTLKISQETQNAMQNIQTSIHSYFRNNKKQRPKEKPKGKQT